MGHTSGMKNEHKILLMEKKQNTMVFKYKLVSKLFIIMVSFIAIINLLCNLFVNLTKFCLDFEINMLTCNRCRRTYYTRQVHSIPHGLCEKMGRLYDKKREEVLE